MLIIENYISQDKGLAVLIFVLYPSILTDKCSDNFCNFTKRTFFAIFTFTDENLQNKHVLHRNTNKKGFLSQKIHYLLKTFEGEGKKEKMAFYW